MRLRSIWLSGKKVAAQRERAADDLSRWRVDSNFVDLRTLTDNPLEAFYRAGGKPALVNIPLSQILNLGPLAFPVIPESGDPYIATAQDLISGLCREYPDSHLEWFYSRWQPRSAADLLGLTEGGANRLLFDAPPHAVVYPWESATPVERGEKKLRGIRKENIKHGVDLPAADGFKWCGPLSIKKGELELNRLKIIVESVARHGYQEIIGSPGGRLIMRGTEWRVLGFGGDHRRAVRVALSWTDIPMRLREAIIRREDVASWPNVRSGLFSEDQALVVFDRIFEGRQPRGCPICQKAS